MVTPSTSATLQDLHGHTWHVLHAERLIQVVRTEVHHVLCRRLFAELKEGPKGSADPTAFAESLNLDRSYQQVFLCGSKRFSLHPSVTAYLWFLTPCTSAKAAIICSSSNLTKVMLTVQDGQEFFKLLLNLLEAKLAKSSILVCSTITSSALGRCPIGIAIGSYCLSIER